MPTPGGEIQLARTVVQGDGDCLFEAVGKQINRRRDADGEPALNQTQLRKRVVEHMEFNKAAYADDNNFMLPIRNTATLAAQDYPETYGGLDGLSNEMLLDECRTLLGQPGEYAHPLCDHHLTFMSRAFDQPIEVYQERQDGTVGPKVQFPVATGEDVTPARILYNVGQTHYDALLPPEATPATADAKPSQGDINALMAGIGSVNGQKGPGDADKIKSVEDLKKMSERPNPPAGMKGKPAKAWQSLSQAVSAMLANGSWTAIETALSGLGTLSAKEFMNAARPKLLELMPKTEAAAKKAKPKAAAEKKGAEQAAPSQQSPSAFFNSVTKYSQEAADMATYLFFTGRQFVDNAGQTSIDPPGNAQCQLRTPIIVDAHEATVGLAGKPKDFAQWSRAVDGAMPVHGIDSPAGFLRDSVALTWQGRVLPDPTGVGTMLSSKDILKPEETGRLRHSVTKGTAAHIRHIAAQAADRSGSSAMHQLMESAHRCNVVRKEQKTDLPMYYQPFFAATKSMLIHEFKAGRPITVNMVRLAVDAEQGTVRMLDNPILQYRPNQETGKYELEPEPTGEMKRQVGTIMTCYTVVELDQDGNIDVPDYVSSDRERNLLSPDPETFKSAMAQSSIEHFILTAAAAHPQFTGPTGAVPTDTDKYLRGDIDPLEGQVLFDDGGVRRCLEDYYQTRARSPEENERRLRFTARVPELAVGDPNYSLFNEGELPEEFARLRATAAGHDGVDRMYWSALDPKDNWRLGTYPTRTTVAAPVHVYAGPMETVETFMDNTQLRQLEKDGVVKDRTLGLYVASGGKKIPKTKIASLPQASQATKSFTAEQMQAVDKTGLIESYERARFDSTRSTMLRLQAVNDSIVQRANQLLPQVSNPGVTRALGQIIDYFSNNNESVPERLGIDSHDINDHMDPEREYLRDRALTYLAAVEQTTPAAKQLDGAKSVRDQITTLMLTTEDEALQQLADVALLTHCGAISRFEECVGPGEGTLSALLAPVMSDELSYSENREINFLVGRNFARELGVQIGKLQSASTRAIAEARQFSTTGTLPDDTADEIMDVFREESGIVKALGLDKVDLTQRTMTLDAQIRKVEHATKLLTILQQGPDYDGAATTWPQTYREQINITQRELVILYLMTEAAKPADQPVAA